MRFRDALGFCAVLLLLTACNRDGVQVYRVAKERPMGSAENRQLPEGHPDTSAGAVPPELKWTLPSGWEQVEPGEMRVASFKVQKDGKVGEMGVVPLPGLMGRDLESVNRWRGSVGQPPITEEDLPKLAQKIEIAGQEGELYEQAGENPGSGDKTRILAAILRRQNVAWFFKFSGDDELVVKEKPAFLSLLKTLSFSDSRAAQGGLPASHPPISGGDTAMTTGASHSGEAKPSWQVPSGWREAPAGQFLVAKFEVAGPDNSQAAVNVSMSAGSGGGVAGNVNRWRGQLGLAELSEDEVTKLTKPLETAAGKAVMVDMSGTDARSGKKARLVAAIVPRNETTWFFKLMGDEQVVEAQKEAFSGFVKTVKYN